MSEAQVATKSGAPDPLIGRVIADRFRITELLARGGMGKVYCAEQAPLGRACAVKILNANYTGDGDPEFHQRFFREASITSKITHPNSVTIFDYGRTEDDIYYMAMELLEGQTLHQALRESGPMPEARVGRIASQICRALREAHALDVIHRDLKPANIFLTVHGDDEDFVKVLDFGLVKHLSERPEEQLTQTGLFMGSPKYMAPEQIQGSVVDARTDIYSLGIIMYEMLAGKVPFERATSVNILMAHVGEPPPPMREVNPNLLCSMAFEELVMRCISKDPDKRFRTMDEVLYAIKMALNLNMTGQLSAVMTGQLSAIMSHAQLSANGTGNLTPPPVYSSIPPGMPILASGSHTPASLDAQSAADYYGGSIAPRSRWWIAGGAVGAALVGGLLGLAAFHVAGSSTPEQVVAATTPAPAQVASSSAEPQEMTTRSEPTATIRIMSEPAGASVREEGVELCETTPCDVTFIGEADTSKPHKFILSKAGFRPETRSVQLDETPVTVKLTKLPYGTSYSTVSTPRTNAPAPSNNPTTPNGFKDLPY